MIGFPQNTLVVLWYGTGHVALLKQKKRNVLVEKPERNGTLDRSRHRRECNIMSGSWIKSIGRLGLDLLPQDKGKAGFLSAVIKALDYVECRVFLTNWQAVSSLKSTLLPEIISFVGVLPQTWWRHTYTPTAKGRQHLHYLMFVKTDWNAFFLSHVCLTYDRSIAIFKASSPDSAC